MLKILGAALILAGCIGYSSALLGRIKHAQDVLDAGRELTELLAAEIRYECLPMEEVFDRIVPRVHMDLGRILLQIRTELADGEAGSLDEIWQSHFSGKEKMLDLSTEELHLLLEIGRNLGYLDVGAQLNHLQACREKINAARCRRSKILEEQTKVYRALSLAAGVFLILILL